MIDWLTDWLTKMWMLCRVALRKEMVEQRINSEMQIKVLIEPMNNPLSVSSRKRNQGTTRGKEKNLLTSLGSIPTEVKIFFSLPRVVLWFPLLGLTPSGLFMGSISTLIYTSELILCSTICVHTVVLRGTTFICNRKKELREWRISEIVFFYKPCMPRDLLLSNRKMIPFSTNSWRLVIMGELG